MNVEKNRVCIKVWGDLACFTRPEMKVERVSYDVLTPSAARGILEAIYWKPAIRWVIRSIQVLRPIQFTNIRRNELGGVGPSDRTLRAFLSGEKTTALAQVIEDDRQQRAATLLKEVAYLINAHYVVVDGSDSPQKHYEMFRRRAIKGQYFHHPYLGCREFVADYQWHEGPAPSIDESLLGKRDLGFMLHDIDFDHGMEPRFFRAEMNDGLIEIPDFHSQQVKS